MTILAENQILSYKAKWDEIRNKLQSKERTRTEKLNLKDCSEVSSIKLKLIKQRVNTARKTNILQFNCKAAKFCRQNHMNTRLLENNHSL